MREDDRCAMSFAFERWSSDDVTKHADAILGQLEDGTMPGDGALAGGSVDFFRRWLAQGAPGYAQCGLPGTRRRKT